MSAPPALPLVLASTSPQRRAILEQLRLPFVVVPPRYEERERPGVDSVDLVREHARGKARSVTSETGEAPIIGVDTAVVLEGAVYGKPSSAGEAEHMLERLSGQTHAVVSGLAVLTPGWEAVVHVRTLVQFRELVPRELAAYVASREWEGRAGAYAIQGLGASLVERIDGDYLNVVGLPATALVRILAERFSGVYGFG